MSKKFYVIEDFIDTTSDAFALTGTSPLSADAEAVTMASSANVLAEIEQSFGERSIYIKETETPFVTFATMWSRWRSRRGDMLAAAWEALHSEYNPLENYDRVESGKDTKKITPAEVTNTITPAETTNTITPAETTRTETPAETTNTITPAETTNTVTPAETTNTNTIVSPGKVSERADTFYAFNSSDPVPTTGSTVTDTGSTTDELTVQTAGTDKIEVDTAGSEAITVQHAGTDKLEVDTAGSEALTVQHAGTNKLEVDTSGEEETTYGHRVRGNIGVTTSQQMAESEIALREKDLVWKAICEFIQLYTVYA